MTISQLPLSYCTNVHPARTLADVRSGLLEFSQPIRDTYGHPLAVGLWLARSVVDELLDEAARTTFAQFLRECGLTCYTLNTFPYGDFHNERVKEQVYIPDWTTPARQQYTLDCARILTALLPEGEEGSLSTVPLGFKSLATAPGFLEQCREQLIETALQLQQLHSETGKLVRLAIEPEPLCVLETTGETIAFFQSLRESATSPQARAGISEYLGICYDICHQAVEFEDVVDSIRQLDLAGIRINKVHISCAIEARGVADHPEVRSALLRYVEPRYLHQTFAKSGSRGIVHCVDLSKELITNPPPEFREAETWRVHFHVPVSATSLGPLQTTRPDLERALPAIAQLPYAPHLEVETYTWEVMPDGGRPHVVSGLAQELSATRELLKPFPPRN